MHKERIKKIAGWSTVALIVPVFGQLFVDGWNWGPGEFVFAWVFFNVLGLTYVFVTDKISRPRLKLLAGIAVVLSFAFVWVTLARG
jgi:hypothetical protein